MADFRVTTLNDVTADDGELSLREAIAAANANPDADTITFSASLAGGSVLLNQSLYLSTDITVSGDVDGDGKADITLNGQGYSNIMAISNGTVTLDALTFKNGSGNFSGQAGGALRITGADTDVTLANSRVTENFGYYNGGGIFVGAGNLTTTNVLIDGNTGYGYAGSNGGGLHIGPSGSATLINTTVFGNDAGGYYSGYGAGVYVSGDLTLVHSTIVDNVAINGSSGYTNPSSGGGVFVTNTGTLNITNSLIVGNSAASNLEIAGTVNSTTGSVTAGDVVTIFGGTPALVDNGGPVPTLALRNDPTNPALDVGVALPDLPTDATGRSRADDIAGVDNGGLADAGAYEVQVPETPSFVVTTLDDVIDPFDDQTSLREAITLANYSVGYDEITFAAGLNGRIRLESTLDVTDGLSIDGDGRILITGDVENDDHVRDGLTDIDSSIRYAAGYEWLDDNVGLFYLNAEDNVTLRGLTLTGGVSFAYGGAVDAYETNLKIVDSIVAGNFNGSDRENGGVIYASSNLEIINSDFISNRSLHAAGAITFSGSELSVTDSLFEDNAVDVGNGGAIYASGGELTIQNTTFLGNDADFGGAIYATGTVATIKSTTFSNNLASSQGGAIFLSGDSNSFENVTFATNFAGAYGGAIGVGTGGFTANHVTMTGNYAASATDTGAVYQAGSGQIVFTNSLVIGNGPAGTQQLVLSDPSPSYDGGNNIFDHALATQVFAQTTTAITTSSPMTFGVLADNGGPVPTVALRAQVGNPALDSASDTGPATDARGRNRFDLAGLGLAVADIGAFELINTVPDITTSGFSVPENSTSVGTISVRDGEDETLAFEILGGADAAQFNIDPDTGALAFRESPNFEVPRDAGGDNVFDLIVGVSDGMFSDSQAIQVTVTDVREAVTVVAGPGDGTVIGSEEGDVITGSTGNNLVETGPGDDIIVDPGGDDRVDAGAGNDRIGLISGSNMVSGGDGDDLIVGGINDDVLMGDGGNDVILGDVSTNLFGSDEITGGLGNDLLEGRGGVDTFVFAPNEGNDTIGALDIDFVNPANTTVTGADFVSGVDRIELQDFALADGAAALGQVTDVGGVATFSAEGTTITFAGLTASDLSADDFILI